MKIELVDEAFAPTWPSSRMAMHAKALNSLEICRPHDCALLPTASVHIDLAAPPSRAIQKKSPSSMMTRTPIYDTISAFHQIDARAAIPTRPMYWLAEK